MTINLNKIFDLQKELDKKIHQQHNVSYSTIFNELKLALIVELAETANEIRSFKFWSYKQPSAKNIILEEYADGLHFITSLGIHLNIHSSFNINEVKLFTNKKDITKAFLELFKQASMINDGNDVFNWYAKYIEFGLMLGFSIEDITNSYIAKCKINHQRQKENY